MTARRKISHAELERQLEACRRELAEANEQQAATSEILRIISSSPTDIQPVFDAMAQSAARLIAVKDCVIRLRDGDSHRPVAHFGAMTPEPPTLLRPETGFASRALAEARTVHVTDVRTEFPNSPGAALGLRSVLVVPFLREGVAIGCIVV